MTSWVVPLATVCSLGLGAVGMSFLAFFHATSSARVAERRARVRHAELEAAVEAARQSVNGLATQVQDIQELAPAAPPSPSPRSGLNLSKRSQALRMHRRGDDAAKIAAALGVPFQEIDLLLKVHRIVLQNLIVTTPPASLSDRAS